MGWAAIAAAAITAAGSIIAVVITVNNGNKKSEHRHEVDRAVMHEKIDELTREVRLHNDFALKIPELFAKYEALEKRVEELSRYHKP